MKTLAFMIMLALALEASAHDHPSVHGMLVVGNERIYLSHLPMFHAPHDYQLIVEVELDATSSQIYLQSLSSSPEKVYTLVPEAFSLPEMVRAPRPFGADLYRGHFERGGDAIARGLHVEIRRVIYFKKLNPQGPRPKKAQYLLFGHEREQFLAHVITSRPNFDQVLELASSPDQQFGHISLPVSDLEPLEVPATIGSLQVKSEVYLETGDLSM